MSPMEELFSIQLAEFFAAFSDSSRLRIIQCLINHPELSVGEIAENVNLSESATSHQLRTLRQMNVVKTNKVGRQVYYTLDDEHVEKIMDIGITHLTHKNDEE